MSVKILRQFPTEAFVAQIDCNGESVRVEISREAVEDYFGVESIEGHPNKSKMEEDLVAKVFVYIDEKSSRGPVPKNYIISTVSQLNQIIGDA